MFVRCLYFGCDVKSPLTLSLCSKHFGLAVEFELLDEVREHLGIELSQHRKYKPYVRKRATEYAPAKTLLGRRAPAGAPLAFLKENAARKSGECLIWPFGRYENGYGAIIYEGRQTIAHRVMCRLAHGEPAEEYFEASHTCENGHIGCVSPDHLVWETHYDNHQRRVGRTHKRIAVRTHPDLLH